MTTFEEARRKILTEVTADDAEVRASYLKHFGGKVEEFADAMAQAFLNWQSLNANAEKDVRRAYVSALVYMAITLHVQSLKVFLLGLTVAAGNLMRQVFESIALALLSSGKDHTVLDSFMEDKYLASHAIQDVLSQTDRLGLNRAGLKALKEGQKFYHNYSHPSRRTIATGVEFSAEGLSGGLFVGAAFDPHKIERHYGKEMENRLGLARFFSDFVDAVKANLAKW